VTSETMPSEAYLRARIDQIAAAGRARDGNLLVAVVDAVRADGYPQAADRLATELLRQGWASVVARGGW